MKYLASIATFMCVLLSGCKTLQQDQPVAAEKQVGWFTAAHNEHPNAIVEVGWFIVVNKPNEKGVSWTMGKKTVFEPELRELLARFKEAGIDGFLIRAKGDLPVSAITKTLDLLHEYGRREVVLFDRIEGVESDFFWELRDEMSEFEEDN